MQAKYPFSRIFRIVTMLLLMLSLMFSGAGSLAPARAQGRGPLFFETKALSTVDPPQGALRTRLVGIDFGVLSGPQGDLGSRSLQGSTIQMNLFEDIVYNVVIDSVEASASGGIAWSGHILWKDMSYAQMVYTDGIFAAHIASPDGAYEVQYAGEDVYWVSQVDTSRSLGDDVAEQAPLPNPLPAVEPDVHVQADTLIDVMVLYTPRAMNAVGGLAAMNARIDLMVQQTNDAFNNSGVHQRFNLVHRGQVDYDEGAPPNFLTIREDLRRKTDGNMDYVHTWRDAYGADLVNLVVEGQAPSGTCGMAYIMQSVSSSFEEYGFSTINLGCATSIYGFAHEVGHNMGSRHDTYMDSTNTPYPFSHGYVNLFIFAPWRTIMAYGNQCQEAVVPFNCPPILHYSSPGINYGLFPTGNATADNSLSLNNTAPTVAAFRPAPTSHLISGTAGVSGVTFTVTGQPPAAPSPANGSYNALVPRGWTGTVTPTHPCYTFTPASRSYTNLLSNQTSQDFTRTVKPTCADIRVSLGAADQGGFGLSTGQSTRVSLPGANNGPVRIASSNAVPLIAAERVIYKVNGTNTSFSEMMGLPSGQVSNVYWLPWYDNVTMNTQLRFGHFITGPLIPPAIVQVFIGGQLKESFSLNPGQSTRKSYTGVNTGPVQIVSSIQIVAAERVIYKAAGGVDTSFSEMMGLSNSQLDTTHWLPWYNNKDLSTELRIGNTNTTAAADVDVYIGGQWVDSFSIGPTTSVRKTYPGVNSGPVQVFGTTDIVVSERVIYKVNGVNVSYSEMMALPDLQLHTTYWLPWYNNKDLNTQLRIGNVSDFDGLVSVYIGGVEMPGSPFFLEPGASTRVSFTGINAGPVQISSDVPIVAAERVIYKVNGVDTSFTEMMGLPHSQLSREYLLPWYNNVDLDTQLRFGVP